MEMSPGPLNLQNTETAFSHRSDKELRYAHRLYRFINNPVFTKAGIALTRLAVALRLPVKPVIRATIYRLFCGGETVDECLPVMKKISQRGVTTLLDYGIEGKSSEAEADEALRHKLETIRQVKSLGHVPVTTMKFTSFCQAAVLQKIHEKKPLSPSEQTAFQNARKRLDTVCDATLQAGMSLFIDAEESWLQPPIDELTDEMMERYNRQRAVVFNTFQLYRTDRLEFLKQSFEKSRQRGFILGAKLVRGAYVEQENERARKLHYISPVHKSKEHTDRDYNAAVSFCVDHIESLMLCAGTHNEESLLHLAAEMKRRSLPSSHPGIFHAQLYGMSDHLTFNMAAAGYRSSKLIPYGAVRDVVPYLLRRAMENTAVKGEMSRELRLLSAELKRRGG